MNDIKNIIRPLTMRDIILSVLVFLVIIAGSKLGKYVYFFWETSPAVLWPSAGIGLAVIWLGGYRYAVPVFLALVVSSLTGPLGYSFPAVIITPLGQVLGMMVGKYLLHHYGFEGKFESVRNVLIFLATIVVASMVAPSITTIVSLVSSDPPVAAYYSWSRAWAGYILSCLIMTPLLITWWQSEKVNIKNSTWEASFVGMLLFVSVYVLFWTQLAANFSFLVFSAFFIAHFWISYRFSTRIVMLSLFVTTVLGILGLFIVPNPERALNQQLFATELFLFLVAPIFYLFSAVVKERVNTTNELKLALTKIEKENTVKSNFIGVLAHELRNPLAPIKTTLEILAELKLDADIQKLVSNATHQVHSMRRLLDDLLDITRVNQGKFQVQIQSSNLHEMMSHAITLTKALFAQKRIAIIQPVYDDSIYLNVDPVRFEQAVVNILNNAAKYTNEGGQIKIRVEIVGEEVEISISDNGIGIEPDHISDIFEPFWQVRTSHNGSAGGIGVGLSLTRYIVEIHGGQLKAQSAGRGKGSTFTIIMPYHQKNAMKQTNEDTTSMIRSFKILVVDDSHAAADSLAKLLSIKGHTAKTAYTGAGAIESLKDFTPDVILLDIGLPDISGYEVAEKMRVAGYANKIVALSGYGQKEDKVNALAAGCDLHITKPMAIARFEEYLKEISEERRP